MRHLRRQLTFGCALLILLIGKHPGSARANDLKLGVTTLFQLAEKNTPTQVVAARAEYESLVHGFSNSAGLDYSYGLVLINQHRYADAVPLIERYLARYANDENAIRVKIWTQLQARQYQPALEETVRLSRRIDDRPANAVERHKQTAHFVGLILGYLELARPEAIDNSVLREAKHQVLSAFSARYLDALDSGRRTVVDRLAALTADRRQKQQRTTEELAARREDVSLAIEDDRQTIAFSRENMESSTEELRDAQRKLIVIKHQLGTLANDRAQLAAQTIAVEAQLARLLLDTSDTRQPVGPGPTPATGTTSLNLSNYPQIVALSANLTQLQRRTFRLDQRINSLRAEGNQINVVLGRASQDTAQYQNAIEKAGRRTKALEAQVRRIEKKKPKQLGLSAEMKKLSTYLPFPFEQEKKRVLGWFKN